MIGMQELLVIGVLIALIFGGKRFAEVGKGLGQGLRGFKDAVTGKDTDEPHA